MWVIVDAASFASLIGFALGCGRTRISLRAAGRTGRDTTERPRSSQASTTLFLPPLRNLRRIVRAYLLLLPLVAIGATVALQGHQRVSMHDLSLLLGIVAFGIVEQEMTRNVERLRRRLSEAPHQSVSAVWALPTALALPPCLVAAVVTVLHAHQWIRSWRLVNGTQPIGLIFNAAVVTLSCLSATAIKHAFGPAALTDGAWQAIAALGAAILAYAAVSLTLVAAAIVMVTTRCDAHRLVGATDDLLLESVSLALSAVATILFLRSPWVVLLLVPALSALHRIVLFRQLQEAVATDAKTGLLDATAWRGLARKEFERAARKGNGIGVLMLDLDHFKQVNDTHGHLTGDDVLVAVAQQLDAEMREYDLLGRFGGEEFVVLCPALDEAELPEVGERLREAVERVSVPVGGTDTIMVRPTVSVGAAQYPNTGPLLEDVMSAADRALYLAKRRGRNRLEIATSSRTASCPIRDPDHDARLAPSWRKSRVRREPVP
jgi:diguanylate cyclase (GGDEF)-like protein